MASLYIADRIFRRRTLDRVDDDELQPTCEICGTVMYVIDGGYRCRGCGYEVGIPWVEHPGDGDGIPGILGG